MRDGAAEERRQADDLVRQGRFREAAVLYAALAAEAPEDESLLLDLAWALHDGGCEAVAVACFERLFEREIGRPVFTGFAFDELVRIFREKKDHDRLVALCVRAVEAHPEDPGILGELGGAFLAAGRGPEAVAVYERIAALEPDRAETFSRLGLAWMAAGDGERALAACERAAALEPAFAGVFFRRLAEAAVRVGNLPQAEAACRRCLVADAANPLPFLELAAVLVRLGRLAEAREAAGEAARRDGQGGAACWNRLGNCLLETGHAGEAFQAFQKAAAADPDNPFYPLRLTEARAAAARLPKTGGVFSP